MGLEQAVMPWGKALWILAQLQKREPGKDWPGELILCCCGWGSLGVSKGHPCFPGMLHPHLFDNLGRF